LPLRAEGKPVAVVTCERVESAFTAAEVDQLRLSCDQVSRRLVDLHRHDRWFGSRWAAYWKEKSETLVGPRHTTAKIAAILGFALVVVLFFVRVPYRVEGNFVVKSDNVSYRTAPFDGYIEAVYVRPGDAVKPGTPLLQLVTRELELEQSAASADLTRYQREAEKARATNDLASMRVALALAEQSKARLELVKVRLAEATVRSPFEGVVVEGDLRDRLAAPVKQGDTLLRIAKLENLYVETEIKERDVHEVLERQKGEISFVSQPKLSFPVRVEKLEPAAFPRTEGNVFLLRCAFEKGAEPWWRPGMSGLCKVNVEPRTLWWILTHRTVDFLRLKLWW
jgi:multidrug resistance efflux pump